MDSPYKCRSGDNIVEVKTKSNVDVIQETVSRLRLVDLKKGVLLSIFEVIKNFRDYSEYSDLSLSDFFSDLDDQDDIFQTIKKMVDVFHFRVEFYRGRYSIKTKKWSIPIPIKPYYQYGHGYLLIKLLDMGNLNFEVITELKSQEAYDRNFHNSLEKYDMSAADLMKDLFQIESHSIIHDQEIASIIQRELDAEEDIRSEIESQTGMSDQELAENLSLALANEEKLKIERELEDKRLAELLDEQINGSDSDEARERELREEQERRDRVFALVLAKMHSVFSDLERK